MQDGVEATVDYLAAGSRINRRYVAPGAELNTGRYVPHRVFIRNGRPLQGTLGLDTQGFVLAKQPSLVTNFKDRTEVDAVYSAEVERIVKALTGADLVVLLGYVLRTSGTTSSETQPPASEAHVDMTSDRAVRLAAAMYEKSFAGRPGFGRFIASSLWRPFSKPPQDWPLALCDGTSVGDGEGVANVMVRVAELPDPDNIPADCANEDQLPAASVFHFNPAHRWWYFPDMTRDEVLLVKFHDSDHSRAWRTPHTAFRDPRVQNAAPRESIEFRTIAYFLRRGPEHRI
ncbi:MAG TPA: CmcJ/NvfI family oxidoreductase [Steroidobacteraceae bacterium]|nr:CmcJ/NvfI family oxidoreductase [Steroidobacteraceae bacterium]